MVHKVEITFDSILKDQQLTTLIIDGEPVQDVINDCQRRLVGNKVTFSCRFGKYAIACFLELNASICVAGDGDETVEELWQAVYLTRSTPPAVDYGDLRDPISWASVRCV